MLKDVILWLLVAAGLVCFLLVVSNRWTGKTNLVALGLACWIMTEVIERWPW